MAWRAAACAAVLACRFAAGIAAEPTPAKSATPPTSVSSAIGLNATPASATETELAKLRQENELLRQENQRLRRMLAEVVDAQVLKERSPGEPAAATTATTPPATSRVRVTAAPPSELAKDTAGYWLSTSGRRHNSSCRYFKKTDGRSSGPQEGTPCKLCGG
jgi:hypothetical protein